MQEPKTNIIIYTDGSCHTQHKVGAWASIILINNEEVTLKNYELNTTHNRMEMIGVLESLKFIESRITENQKIIIKSDSQYVIRIQERIEKLEKANFKTKGNNEIKNKDLVIQLINYIKKLNIEFVKVKAHQKKTSIRNINIEVDKISRKIVRNYVKNNY